MENIEILKKNNPLRFADLQAGDTVFIQYHPREKYRFWEFGKVIDIKENHRSALAEISLERPNLQKSDLLGAYVDEVDVVQRVNEPASPMVNKLHSYMDLDFLNFKENPDSNGIAEKLREIYLGLQHGVDVDRFVRPEYSADLMKEIRLDLEKDIELDQFQDEWDHEL
ncbi:hypothetical protein Desde_3186 [Desulfitobacterium dehalogenans ATCC 51507]|uniref:Uncharacterized protein n=1 Tax=Desulfitobacterium dehalogenans (strain ATCC 51507 / DSM 9161 / JW/IU-DC1) TaxID=756499 RepID=I4ABZ2_DESDJ|nr:hypothetical protein [Desulfitobacterium dehalogenans]AFM01477.1 hypothetical protein Desde_3186 [Desulfitobacterium dehalogenans ATCC 51507]